jgi:hypothetical protein
MDQMYPSEKYAQINTVGTAKQANIRDRLLSQITYLERQTKDAREALALLDKNPDLERLHDLLNRV